MLPIIEGAEVHLRTESMKAAKEFLRDAIRLNAFYDDEDLMKAALSVVIAQRTKALFTKRLEELLNETKAFITDEELKQKAEETVIRAKEETGEVFEAGDAYAIIRTMPFYSFSAALQALQELHAETDHDIRSDNFKSYHYEYCLKAGASRKEAQTLVKQFGDKALDSYLRGCSIKKMRFQYYRTIHRADLTAVDRIFIENCLLRVAHRITSNKAILSLYDAVGTIQDFGIVPAGIKRRLLDYALII